MAFPDALSLGLTLSLAGLAFWLGIRLFTRRFSSSPFQTAALSSTQPLHEQTEAVLVITGGKVIQANSRARDLFHIADGEQPNLERLARRIRPANSLYEVCAAGRQARLALDGRMIDCSAYRLALQPSPLVVVSFRDPPDLSAEVSAPGSQTLHTFMALNQTVNSSLDVQATVQAVLLGIQKLLPADWMEITLWDAEEEVLVPYRMAAVDAADPQVEMPALRYHIGEGYSGRLAAERQPVLETDLQGSGRPVTIDQTQVMLHAYLGVPLMAGEKFIGTLELASMIPGAFRENDLQVVNLVSGQAAAALNNALLFQTVQKRMAELSGLAQLSQAFGSARDPRTLFTRLVESILPLVKVEILGFLLYNETQRLLEGQIPFHGIPEQFMEMYRIPVPSGGALEKALIDQEVLASSNALEDRRWEALGIGPVARGASLRETVLVPLSSGGRVLGYLQASNHTQTGQTFTQDELHLLEIVANQAAPVIDNLTLIQQQRQRAQRAEALRRIASLASSAANLEEILRFSLQELAHLLNADVAAIFLFDTPTSTLQFHAEAMFGSLPPLPEDIARLHMDDPQFHFTVTASQRALNTGSLSLEQAVIPFYQSIQTFWGLESVVAVPLIVRDEGIGELWLGSRESYFFDQGSQQVAVTAAGQLAGVVEQSYLVAQTDESLRLRVEQLSALTRITRELSSSLDLRYLLQLVYDESLLTTRADCGTIRLFDLNRPSSGAPRTRFFIGEQPSADLSPFEIQALEKGGPVCIPDFSKTEQAPPLEGICSALWLPIVYQKKQTGLMALYSRQPDCFDATTIEISQTLAIQAAVVLGSALQYEEQTQQGVALQRELKTLDELFNISRTARPGQPLDSWLEGLTRSIRSATPFQMVVISLYEPDSQQLRRVCSAGLTPGAWADLQAHRQPWQAISTLLQPEFKVGSVYFIPADRRPQVPAEMHTVMLLPEIKDQESDAWDARDFLLIPLLDGLDQPLGLISVDAPSDGRRPDFQTLQTLEIFALQASIMLQSYSYTCALQAQLDALKADAQRLEIEAGQSRVSIPQLIQRQEEQAGVIEMLQRQVERVHHGLEIAEQANRQSDRLSVLQSVAVGMMNRYEMQTALVAEKTAVGFRLVDIDGIVPPAANPEALFGQRNPLRQVMQDGDLLLVSDLETEPAWQSCALLHALDARSFIALSFKLNDNESTAVLVVSSNPLPPFSEQDRQVFTQVASQISVSLQKLDLLVQARRRLKDLDILVEFSRKLGSFDPADILNTLLASALRILPAAQAGWAGLWDERNRQLVPGVSSGYSDPSSLASIRFRAPDAGAPVDNLPLPLRGVFSGSPLSVQDVQFTRDYSLPAEDLLHYRRASAGRLPVSDMIIPIRLADHPLGVLVLENFTAPAVFTADDENLSLSLAQQAALALENARLLQSAEQRAAQLQSLTQVSGAITASLSSEDLIASLLDQLASVLPFDTATLWLREGNSLQVQAARGFEDDASLLGVSVSVEDSQLFYEMAASSRPIYVPDVRKDSRFPSIAEAERISWLGIPLVAKSELVGVIAVDKIEVDFYTPEHIQVATTFSAQAAVALENARLFEESQRRAVELDQRSQRLALLNRLSSDLSASLDVSHILHLTCQELFNGLGVSHVGAVLLDEKRRYYLEEEVPLDQDELPLLLPETPLFARLFESQGIFHSSDAAAEEELRDLYYEYLKRRNTHALLVVPLLCGSNLHGWLLLQCEQEYRFSLPEMELARTIANQAAAAIQNARLFAETRRLTQDLELRVRERTSEVTREHHNSQTLLRIITELSASLDMGLVLNRTLAVLNEAVSAEQSLIILVQGNSRIYSAGPDVVGLKGVGGKASRVDQEIARAVTRRRAPILVDDLWIDNRWGPIEETLHYRSVLAVPLILGEDVLGSLLLFHRKPTVFAQDQIQMVEAAARQISISINNADLFNLIRDQSEHLGGMLREQQIEASRSRAILEAVADGVLVTDADGMIYLFNASAQRILGLPAGRVLGKSLDQFSGLFGKAGIQWMRTIHTWSEDTASYQPDELYSERLELDNGRIVEVHLSPVILRAEFFGTVSIFRDITHEVQVDRLKSEFVANVSHELRTPMTSIKGYVDIMLLGAAGELDPRQAHFLEIVRSNTERLAVLVNDLLDVSQIESGRITLTLQPLKLREIAEDVIADISRRSQEEGRPMKFVLDIPEDLPRINGDLERIRQVISNLVSNGYNYTPENGQVTVRMRPLDGFVQVDVVDTGVGIPREDQNRIFERFYRGEDSLVLATAGTGLGLAITKSLVEMHGGQIWFSSTGVRGEGSTFSVTLPVYTLTLAG